MCNDPREIGEWGIWSRGRRVHDPTERILRTVETCLPEFLVEMFIEERHEVGVPCVVTFLTPTHTTPRDDDSLS